MSAGDGKAILGRDTPAGASWIAIVVFISVAVYNVVELNFLIASTFKRFRGLYFWNFLVATWGITFNAIGYLLRGLGATRSHFIPATMLLVGWCSMTTSQSLVLYSRLHIVLHDPTRLRYVLAMIIANVIWLGIPVIVLFYGVSSASPQPFDHPYSIFEKLQLLVFCIQELVISGLYVYETAKLLRLQRTVAISGARRVVGHLIAVNVFVVVLDISILCLEFTDDYTMQTAWKAMVYSVKLKAEFSVLNRLVDFSRYLRTGGSQQPESADTAADLALERYMRNTSEAGPEATEDRCHAGGAHGDKAAEAGVGVSCGLEVVRLRVVTASQPGRPRNHGGSGSSAADAITDSSDGAGRVSSESFEAQFGLR